MALTDEAEYPLGRLLDRRRIGPFVFVEHEYPVLAEGTGHAHPWLHLTLVRRGHYRRVLGLRATAYKAGSVAFLRAHEPHTDSYAPGTKCLHVVVPAEMERKLAGDLGVHNGAAEMPTGLSARFSIALHSEFSSPDDLSHLIVEALLVDFASRYLNVIRDRCSARPKWLGLLLDLLDDTFEQRWTLRGIAAEMGVHPVHLCRAFSEHFGYTLGEYIRRQRVLRAWQLLAIGDGALAEVAAQSGFADQSHFTRAFKRQFGITPGEWRRRSSAGLPPWARQNPRR
jgi:AraC family transcriptional regulator